jgi:20S proteasome alpha/beta subunit
MTSSVIEAFGSTSLVGVGSNYFLEPNGGSSVELSYGGAPVVAGQFGQWVPIGAEQTASGYEVAWKIAGADQYTVWNTDTNGNYLSSVFDVVSGSSAALVSLETSFQQDLNGDGFIGPPPPPPPTVIEAFGSTSLVQVGSNYFLEPNGGSAIELSYGGAPVVAGQFGQWVPIGAEQTASGYEVVWKMTGADQYTVWNTDSNGNYLSSILNVVSGSSAALESLETSFQQDLNGDGFIPPPPPPPTVIEAFGSTSLLQAGNNYFLEPNGGSAIELSYGGGPVVAGQFGQWVPIGAEQTASGYEVAWKIAGSDQYTVWDTDSNGNYLSSVLNVVSGSIAAFESVETSFQQDLNGDGLIGPPPQPPPTVIETFGSTSLVQVGNNYFLEPNGGSAIELSYGGGAVVAGQFGQWVPIGAEQTASGYEVAWKIAGADQYTVWNTDSNGNYLSSAFNVVSGSADALVSLETSFQQDLNGDGSIGFAPASPPQFIYQGVDANGVQLYDVVWGANSGLQPFAVRVLAPDDPSTNYAHSFLFALPVEPGLAPSTYGDGLDQLRQLGVQNQYDTTIIEPIFPIDSWYADSAINPTIDYDTFMATYLPEWVDKNFATTGAEENLLVGFSKSGYGGLDLLFNHPSVFAAAAAFDFPADMATFNDFGSSSSTNYGTDANFQNDYRMTGAFIDARKAPFMTADRVLISEGPAFGSGVADFDALLTSHGVLHTLLTQTQDPHTWSGGWLASDVAGLFGLAQAMASFAPSSSAAVTSASAPAGVEPQQLVLTAASNPTHV